MAWDVEYIASNEEGLVIFDGGTYSRGPAVLLEPGEVAISSGDESLEADRERLQRQLSLEVSLPFTPGLDSFLEQRFLVLQVPWPLNM